MRIAERISRLEQKLAARGQTITVILQSFARREDEPWMFHVHADGSMRPATAEEMAAHTAAHTATDTAADNATAAPTSAVEGQRAASTPPVIRPPRRRRRAQDRS